jgi:hypothetical protein
MTPACPARPDPLLLPSAPTAPIPATTMGQLEVVRPPCQSVAGEARIQKIFHAKKEGKVGNASDSRPRRREGPYTYAAALRRRRHRKRLSPPLRKRRQATSAILPGLAVRTTATRRCFWRMTRSSLSSDRHHHDQQQQQQQRQHVPRRTRECNKRRWRWRRYHRVVPASLAPDWASGAAVMTRSGQLPQVPRVLLASKPSRLRPARGGGGGGGDPRRGSTRALRCPTSSLGKCQTPPYPSVGCMIRFGAWTDVCHPHRQQQTTPFFKSELQLLCNSNSAGRQPSRRGAIVAFGIFVRGGGGGGGTSGPSERSLPLLPWLGLV